MSEENNKLASFYGMQPEEVAVIKNTVAKGVTNTELAYFFSVCKAQDLNPFLKEVWCYKDNKGNLIIITGRDGFLSKAQKHPRFNGMRSAVVRSNDEFSIDIANAKIVHNSNWKEPGEIIGAYAIVFLRDGEPTITWVRMAEYNKGWNVWKTNPSDMIVKTAESRALKKAFGFSGLNVEEEWTVTSSGIVEPIREVEGVNETREQETALRMIQALEPEELRGKFTTDFLEKYPTVKAAFDAKVQM